MSSRSILLGYSLLHVQKQNILRRYIPTEYSAWDGEDYDRPNNPALVTTQAHARKLVEDFKGQGSIIAIAVYVYI